MRKLPGVTATSVGFAGGTVDYPTYEEVCSKQTGHAEVVRVVFDVRQLTVRELLIFFLELHDFSRDRREGGGQYRSAIFAVAGDSYAVELLREAELLLEQVRTAGAIVCTEVSTVTAFYPATGRHQQYCTTRGLTPKRQVKTSVRALLTAI